MAWAKRRRSWAHLGKVWRSDTHEYDSGEDASGSVDLPDFDIFPEFLRLGPWSPSAYVFLCCVAAFLVWYAWEAFSTFPTAPAVGAETLGTSLQAAQACVAMYCTGVNWILVARRLGFWPFVSFTMVAYVLLTVRFLAGAAGLSVLAEVVRFPALAMCCMTTVVWWLALVPLMLAFMPGGSGARWRFCKFNCSAFLLNVHLLNMPLALFDHYSTWRPLSFWDLWVGIVVAYFYLLFYLLVLDRHEMHFYIILSPRPWWCVLVYLGLLSMLLGMHKVFGQMPA